MKRNFFQYLQTIQLFPICSSCLHSTPYPAHLCKDSSALTCPISTQGKLLLHKGTPTVYKELSNDNFLYLQYGAVCLKLFACNKKRHILCSKEDRSCKTGAWRSDLLTITSSPAHTVNYLLLFLQDLLSQR